MNEYPDDVPMGMESALPPKGMGSD